MRLLFYFLFLSFYACSSIEEEQTPESIIPEEQMVSLITEIELTQAFIKLRTTESDSLNQAVLFQTVFDQLNVTQEEFNESLDFYSEHPQQLEDIYNKVIVSLSEKQASVQLK